MEKIILITGSETLLGRKLVEKNLSAGNKVIAPVLSKDEMNGEQQKKNLLVLPWNKSSVISTRTLIREGMRIFQKIDEAILVYSENKTNELLLDFSTSEIDEAIDNSVKGSVYLTRELLKAGSKGNQPALSFVLTRKNRKNSDPLERGFLGFFRSFADEMILDYKENFCCGFTSQVSDMDSYASFIMSTMNEKPEKGLGQWLDFRERKNLFTGLSILQRKSEPI